MATQRHGWTADGGPSFSEVLDENAPYVGALYLLVVGLAVAFIDYGALSSGELTYRTVGASGGVLFEFVAGLFAAGFGLATVLALAFSADVFLRERRENLDPYELQERIGLVAVMPALQLLAIVLCPVVTGVTIVGGLQFLVGLV
jgi:hypothetical protein